MKGLILIGLLLIGSAYGDIIPEEITPICGNNVKNYTDTEILEAIWKAEGGELAEYYYGIRSVKYNSKWHARDICLETIRNNRIRFINQDEYSDFVLFLGSRYCPVGCDNDRGTNRYWVRNVKRFLGEMRKKGA